MNSAPQSPNLEVRCFHRLCLYNTLKQPGGSSLLRRSFPCSTIVKMLRVLVDAMRRRLSRLCRCRSSKLRAFLVLSFLATAACVGISVGVAYKYLGNVEQHDLPLQGDSLQKASQYGDSAVVSDSYKVNMSITISTVDAENLSLLVAWYPSAVNCPQPPTLINFFFDEYAFVHPALIPILTNHL